MSNHAKLTTAQRIARSLLRTHTGYDFGWGVVTSGETCVLDGQPWINWSTAFALERRGLVEIERESDNARVRLLPEPSSTEGEPDAA